jgi:NAD(P)-dependent dehydrogenase (short-subunit alcohol dehydrogenase family)
VTKEFKSKTIVITGGSTGIGLSSAIEFANRDAAKIYITGRNLETLNEAKEKIGNICVIFQGDVARIDDCEKLAQLIQSNNDKIDVIFANAGIAENNNFGATTPEEFDKIFDINVRGLFFSVQSLLHLMVDEGAIILTSSIVGNKGMAKLSLYNASKAAVRSFARSWANDLRGRKIRVNTLSPGVTLTPIMKNGLKMNDEAIKGFQDYLKDAAPLGRMAQPIEIAKAAIFLASNDASYINGIELSVDGGLAQI